MHPRDLVWSFFDDVHVEISQRLRKRSEPDVPVEVWRVRPEIRDPNSELRGRPSLTTPYVYRINEFRPDGWVRIGPLGPFELVALLDLYEPAPTETVLS